MAAIAGRGQADRAEYGSAGELGPRRWRAASHVAASAVSRRGAMRRSLSCWAAGTVQVCTAAMHYGYRIVEDMIDGLLAIGWMKRDL